MKKPIIGEAVRLVILFVIGCLIGLLITAFLGSCTRTVYTPVETVRYEREEADTSKFMALINSLREEIQSKERTTDSIVREHKKEVTVNEHGDTTKEKELIYIYISHKQEQEFMRIIESQRDSISDLRSQLESVKVDSIPVPYPVERPLSKWETVKMEAGGWAIGAGSVLLVALVAAIVWLVKIKRRR